MSPDASLLSASALVAVVGQMWPAGGRNPRCNRTSFPTFHRDRSVAAGSIDREERR